MTEIIKKLLLALVGMILLAIGLNFILLVDFGTSPYDSLTLLTQQLFNIEQFGNAALLLHTIIAVVLVVYYLIKKKNIIYIVISYASIFVLTRIINMFSFIGEIEYDGLTIAIIYFIIGFLFYVVSVYILGKVNFLIPPYDKFVVELSMLLKVSLGRCRLAADVFILIFTFVMSILLKIDVPFTVATLIITFGTGYIMSMIDIVLNKTYRKKKSEK